jgi:drug/metabolite transporter (DMT)-like permease
MFTVGLVGLLSLGAVSRARIGMDGILSTGSRDLAMMLLAALCNTAGFLALIKALQLTTVVYVNAIGASQVAMSALAGVALFHEALSGSMVAGVAMTTLGLALVERGKAGRRSAGDAAQTGGDGAYSGRCPVEIDPAPPDEAPVLEAD